MTLFMLGLLLASSFFGMLLGYWLCVWRSGTEKGRRALKEQLQLTQQDFRLYQRKVQGHLDELSDLGSQFQERYQALNEHIQSAAHHLNPETLEKSPHVLHTHIPAELSPPRDYALEHHHETL